MPNSKTLYHYCNLNSFLSIIDNSSIWLSDVRKSNDSNELLWFRQQYYSYIADKYPSLTDSNDRSICELLLSLSTADGFMNIPSWLRLTSDLNSELIMQLFKSLRVFSFCLSEMPDSLGQWRGYANDGKGVAIGFSKKYLQAIAGNSLRCPIFNFWLSPVSYTNDFGDLFDRIFKNHSHEDRAKFAFENLMDVFCAAPLFKNPSFKEEKEWRIICSMNDAYTTQETLNFQNFDMIASESYKKNFYTPKIGYLAKDDDIIPHVEVRIRDFAKAITRIVIGPKCRLSENDIKHLLVKNGILKDFNDTHIPISKSASSYR